ncbi:amyloid protein-binding protein 2-like isoform X2 [Littorina saxatilis]
MPLTVFSLEDRTSVRLFPRNYGTIRKRPIDFPNGFTPQPRTWRTGNSKQSPASASKSFDKMTSTLRKNTFVISEMPAAPLVPGHVSGMDRQNLMRLKVNRIALVQELKVEHILGSLIRNGIVTEQDCRRIETGRTPQDRARILIDILPTKNKESDWYKCFRDALLNPEGGSNVKQRYRSLVEFLDNTMIHRPTSQAGKFSETESRANNKIQYPRYKALPLISKRQTEPNVLNLEEEAAERPRDLLSVNNDIDKMSLWSGESQKPMMLVKGFFHQWIPTPDNFRSLIDLPSSVRHSLEKAGTQEAYDLLRQEQTALHYLRRLEVISALARRRQLPVGFELCMCDTVQELLSHPELFHLYLKYVRTLQDADVNIARDMTTSYASVLDMLAADLTSGLHRQVVDIGFKLVELLVAVEMWSLAEEVLQNIINFLRANPAIENWIDEYKALVKLMAVRNDTYELQAAQQSYFSAAQIAFQVQMMSFGQKVLNEGRMHQELGAMMLEYGSIHTSFSWCKQALQEVDPDDPEAVVEVVTHAVMTHCACWQVKKAETLAIFAVQFALDRFGKHHPMYLKALNSLCHLSNEFKQDSIGVQLATELLETTEKVYNCETLHLATAHRTLSKALMAVQGYRVNDDYYTHAMEAVRIARGQLPDGHALLHPFLANFAMALQWKSLHCPKEVKDSTLRWAETEAKLALNIIINHYGDISLRSAQVHTLLGQIYSKRNDMVLAEKHLVTAVEYLKLCQPSSSNYLLLAHATLGTFLTVIGKHDKAIYHLKQVLMSVESTGHYLRWVEVCFQTLITLLQTEGASFANPEEGDRMQVMLSQWLKNNPKEDAPIDKTQLNKAPPIFQDFLEKFDTWGSAVHKIQNIKDSVKGVSLFKIK